MTVELEGQTGLIDEHAPRPAKDEQKDAQQEQYNPSEEERKVIRQVDKLFTKAKKHRSLYDNKWLDYYRFFRGKQHKDQRPSYKSSEVINFIFRTIQSIVPIELDSRPRFEFLPQEPSDLELADILNKAAEAEWTSKNWSMDLLEVTYDKNIYGTGLSSMLHCDEPNEDVEYKSIDPFYFYPDPDSTDVNKRGWFCVYAVPTSVDKIKKNKAYKAKAKFIKADLQDMMKGAKNESGQILYRNPSDNRLVNETSSPLELVQKDMALLITCYMSPEMLVDEFDDVEQPIMEDQPVLDEMGNQVGTQQVQTGVEYVQVAKYPKGRKITICNNVVLEDCPNPYDDGKFPFQRAINYCLPREFWGTGEVEQLMSPQIMFNKVFNFAMDVMHMMGNPVWLVPTMSNIDTENFTNAPNSIIEHEPGQPPQRLEGVQLQPYVMQIANSLEGWINGVSGSQEVSQGIKPAGVTAASAISQLQEAAQTRIRQKVRNNDSYLQDLGQAWLSRTFQFRTAPQMYRLTNSEGVTKYFRMRAEPYEITEAGPDGQEVPTGEMGKRVYVDHYTENGQIDPDQSQVYQTRAEFDVRVSSGSSLPFNKDAKEQKMLEYFDRNIIDREEVLKQSDYPNYQAVLDRLNQAEMAKAQAAAPPAAPAA